VLGIRTRWGDRHIADEVHRLPAEANRRGEPHALCGPSFRKEDVKGQRIEKIAPAVVCARCVEVARRWYAPDYFVTWDSVQRRRLLDALTWDLKEVEKVA
jgi:hypothetical protein